MVTYVFLCLSFPKKTKNHIKREADYTSSNHGRGQSPSKLICRSPSVVNDQTAHISLQILSISKSAETKASVAPFLVGAPAARCLSLFFTVRVFHPAGEGVFTDRVAAPQGVFSNNLNFFISFQHTPIFSPRKAGNTKA